MRLQRKGSGSNRAHCPNLDKPQKQEALQWRHTPFSLEEMIIERRIFNIGKDVFLSIWNQTLNWWKVTVLPNIRV